MPEKNEDGANNISGEALESLTPKPEITIEIKTEIDIVDARSKGRLLARELGFGTANQTRLATAISELTRNIIRYAESGVCIIDDISNSEFLAIRVIVEDHGPGISDIEEAMADGFTSGPGLGAGLPGTRRIVSKMDIETEPGHTRVCIETLQAREPADRPLQ